MMEEDLMSSLTRQVKEEVIQNYLTERRLVSVQIEEIESRVKQLKQRAVWLGMRLNRLARLMIREEMKERLFALLRIPRPSFWRESTEKQFSRRLRLIRVSGLTDRRRFRKLVLESYVRFHDRMVEYRKAHEELQLECDAINRNIMNFQKNFDLLNILSFLRSLDVEAVERKHFLGENFTAEELASVDEKLYIRPVSLEESAIPTPLVLPMPHSIEKNLIDLSDEVFKKCERQVRGLML